MILKDNEEVYILEVLLIYLREVLFKYVSRGILS